MPALAPRLHIPLFPWYCGITKSGEVAGRPWAFQIQLAWNVLGEAKALILPHQGDPQEPWLPHHSRHALRRLTKLYP